jgi:hypothetical protein
MPQWSGWSRIQEVAVGWGGAAEDGPRSSREGAGGFRRCLRPDRCPYAPDTSSPPADAELWGAALAELLPGDPDLAWEIADLLVDEGVLVVTDTAAEV